ncbi:hypothetical protein AJ88_23690 [Mesorhizobium amorphae CCBAU 01583]|nr:hypothetical protein AJ88_23690 [Mesorhizobium amorphae CCBAU 01583]
MTAKCVFQRQIKPGLVAAAIEEEDLTNRLGVLQRACELLDFGHSCRLHMRFCAEVLEKETRSRSLALTMRANKQNHQIVLMGVDTIDPGTNRLFRGCEIGARHLATLIVARLAVWFSRQYHRQATKRTFRVFEVLEEPVADCDRGYGWRGHRVDSCRRELPCADDHNMRGGHTCLLSIEIYHTKLA